MQEGIKTEEFIKLQRLLDQEKVKNKVLEETLKLEQMQKKLEVLRLRNPMLEKHESPQDPLTRKEGVRNPPSIPKLTTSLRIWMTPEVRKVQMRKSLERATQEVGNTPLNQGRGVS